MYRPAHPAAPRTTTRTPTLPRVMVDPTVGLDEPHDALLVEVVERVEPRPRRESDRALHRRVRSEDHLPVVLLDDRLELLRQLRALAVVLHHHAAVLEVVDLELGRDRPRVHAPGGDVREVRPRRRRV